MAEQEKATAQDPYALVASLQTHARDGLLNELQIKEALDLYAKAVDYCSAHDLPVTCVRVEVQGSAWRHVSRPTFFSGSSVDMVPASAFTILQFDGRIWRAYRCSPDMQPQPLSEGLVRAYLDLPTLLGT